MKTEVRHHANSMGTIATVVVIVTDKDKTVHTSTSSVFIAGVVPELDESGKETGEWVAAKGAVKAQVKAQVKDAKSKK